MKKFLVFLLALVLLGCSTTSTVVRDTYMDRAYTFDQKYTGEEFTPEYKWCYGIFFSILFKDCQPQLEDGVESKFQDDYWACADTALDKMEQCMETDNAL
jgi:hypothetical protein